MTGGLRSPAWRQASKQLTYYAIFIFIMGLAGFASNPAKAKSALIMGGASGGLCMLWSYLMHLGIGWSAMAAVITCVALDGAFAWRAYLAWSAYSQGQAEKFAPAMLTTVMCAATNWILPKLFNAYQGVTAKRS